jgi:hypothetical protein
MRESLFPGMNSIATSTAVQVSESRLGSDDGSPISNISGVMAEDKLALSDNLSHFGLGPC